MRSFYFITLLLIGNLSVAQTTIPSESNHGIFQVRVDVFGASLSRFQTTPHFLTDQIWTNSLKYGVALQHETAKGVQLGAGTSLLFNNYYTGQKASFLYYASLGYPLGKNSWRNTPQVELGLNKGFLSRKIQPYAGFAWQVSKQEVLGKHGIFFRPQFDWFIFREEYGLFESDTGAISSSNRNFNEYEFRRITFSATIGIVFNIGK